LSELEYAKRGLVGVLTPQANTTVEPELTILWPAGVAMLNARLSSPKKTIEERLVDYTDQVEKSLDQFANAPIEAVAFACTGASYLLGLEKESALCERVEQARGVPLVTAARAVADSFRTLGAKKIGLVSPYPASLTEASVAYWQNAGFDVKEVANVNSNNGEFHPIYSLQADSSAAALNSLEEKNIDVIVMLGTGMPTLQPIIDVANWNGPPVTSCMLSLAWRTVLHVDNQTPSVENFLSWTKGEDWSERLAVHHPTV
jgi:maleate isomerase